MWNLLSLQLICGALLGLPVLGFAVYGTLSNDRVYSKLYLILNPFYAMFMLLYVLPTQYSLVSTIRADILDQLYGDGIGIVVCVILTSSLLTLLSTLMWMVVERSARKLDKDDRTKRPVLIKEIGVESEDDEDHPYRRKSFDSYL
jgi:hypothetical protein